MSGCESIGVELKDFELLVGWIICGLVYVERNGK